MQHLTEMAHNQMVFMSLEQLISEETSKFTTKKLSRKGQVATLTKGSSGFVKTERI